MPTAPPRLLLLSLFATLLATVPAAGQTYIATPMHGLAMHGDLKYGPAFEHFDYVNPDAPKGGTLTMEATGGFDSFNPFILRGQSAAGLGLIYETLAESAADEAFSEYGLLAETIEMPEDRSWVAFTLHPDARWHDGKPVTADDVIWTFNTLIDKGSPFYAAYYGDVAEVHATSDRRVLFVFKKTTNRELSLILGQLTVLPKHWWEGRDFTQPLLESPLGSGPYRIETFDEGRAITYARVPDYWAKDRPVMKGRYNWNSISFEYYRDREIATEAFKAGAFDFRAENSSKRWATAFDFPAAKAGWVIQEELAHERGSGMQGFLMNTRRPVFADPKVREAITYAFDFEWLNKTLMYNAYTRTESYFDNTELASTGLPSEAELALLDPFRDQLPPEVFTKEYRAPDTDGSGTARSNLRVALKLLREAGWALKDGVMTGPDGTALRFEVLLVQPTLERITLPFVENLKRIGAGVSVRTVDPVQYQNRVRDFDFDMIVTSIGASLSPGNEQIDFWSSDSAGRVGSRNLAGVKSPAVDALVRQIVEAPDRATLVTVTRALDRVLLWGHYMVPHFHSRSFRLIYWNKFGRPATSPKYADGFLDTWWVDPEKETALKAWRQNRN
ncbi:MAG: ABC transporter substrate-binding protein [Alphaproteobacteria bacterium]|nr:ABC transporter substrate-binding protein [Alphaproteobacteria bacterium]